MFDNVMKFIEWGFYETLAEGITAEFMENFDQRCKYREEFLKKGFVGQIYNEDVQQLQ